MDEVNAYAAYAANQPLKPFQVNRRKPGPHDVVIAIEFCGICHSDVHQAKNEWGVSIFPMVPGHEIVGKIEKVGESVKKFKPNDRVGVGCFVDSCRQCKPCKEGLQQYCEKGMVQTYNSTAKDGKTPTYGGYSQKIVVDENYLLKIPSNIPPEKAAPLLCAGITTYSPLRHWKVKEKDKVAVVGLGGLGHMAVKLASAMGAEVTVFSTSNNKKEDALKFGAKHFVNVKEESVDPFNKYFDLIINTAPVTLNLEKYFNTLKLDATMVTVGAPENALSVDPSALIFARRSLAGSLIGGIQETQEMLNFCAENQITPEVEVIPANKINEGFDRLLKGDVRYRFVIDNSTLK